MAHTNELTISRIERAKKRRPLVWLSVAVVLVLLLASDAITVLRICRSYSLGFSDVLSASGIPVGGVDNTATYPGYLVNAGVHFHMFLLTVLLGAGFVVLLARYFSYQDLALELMRKSLGTGQDRT